MGHIRHSVYDMVLDNDWEKYPNVTLYRGGQPYEDIYNFSQWCSRILGVRIKVTFPDRFTVIIRKA